MKIFEPVVFGKFQSKNALIRSATCEFMCDPEGKPQENFHNLYKNLAGQDIGMIITGYAYILPNGKSSPGQSGIYNDEFIPLFKKVTDLFKKSDSLFLMQIVHGGRQVRPKSIKGPVWAPSAVKDPVYKTEPEEMNIQEITKCKTAFTKAAQRAQEAGFDGIQLHAAHGYLLSQFLSPYTNKRDDIYGKDQAGRTRIIVELINEIRNKCGSNFILSAKINGEDNIRGGLELTGAITSGLLLKKAGLDFIEVSCGMSESIKNAIQKPDSIKEGYNLMLAEGMKGKTGLPTATVGGIRSLKYMEDILNQKKTDFISLCRPFIIEPDLVNKFLHNETRQSDCISCNRCIHPRGIKCRKKV